MKRALFSSMRMMGRVQRPQMGRLASTVRVARWDHIRDVSFALKAAREHGNARAADTLRSVVLQALVVLQHLVSRYVRMEDIFIMGPTIRDRPMVRTTYCTTSTALNAPEDQTVL